MTIQDVKIDEKTTRRTIIDGDVIRACGMEFYWRLKKIEDILGEDYDLDRLRELVEAEREGRCVVFKFGLGSTVYRAWVRPDGSHPFVSGEKMNTVRDLVNAESWSDAYKTKEAAEAALKGEGNP